MANLASSLLVVWRRTEWLRVHWEPLANFGIQGNSDAGWLNSKDLLEYTRTIRPCNQSDSAIAHRSCVVASGRPPRVSLSHRSASVG